MTYKGILIFMLMIFAAGGIFFIQFKLIDTVTFIIMEVGSIALLIVNFIEMKKLRETEYKKLLTQAEELYKGKQIQNALKKYTEAANLVPNSLDAHMGKAQCHKVLTQSELALKDCKQAIIGNPDAFQPYYMSGMIYLQLDKPREAITAFHKAQSKNPDLLDAYFLMGQIREKLGEYKEALTNYELYIAKNGTMKDTVIKNVNELRTKLGIKPLEPFDPEKADMYGIPESILYTNNNNNNNNSAGQSETETVDK